MPNAKVLESKKAVVEALSGKIKEASSVVFVDYKGITVAQDTELRNELRKNEVEYSVVKNTLTRFALDNCGLQEMNGILNGTTSLATSTGDPIAPFRVINDYSKKMKELFNIKAAFMDGKVLTDAEIAQLSELPSKDALYSQVFGTMLAPITSLAVVLNQIAEKNGGGSVAEPEAAAE